jgi:hypothetical protein
MTDTVSIEREANRKELAEALDISHRYLPCTSCYMRTRPVADCKAARSCTLAGDWRSEYAQIQAALANYAKLPATPAPPPMAETQNGGWADMRQTLFVTRQEMEENSCLLRELVEARAINHQYHQHEHGGLVTRQEMDDAIKEHEEEKGHIAYWACNKAIADAIIDHLVQKYATAVHTTKEPQS